MPSTHVVEHLAFEVGFTNEDEALARQGWLERFIKRSALGVIAAVFEEWPQAGQVIAIDQLEIDLGVCTGPGDEAMLESRLRERLRIALHDASGSAHAPEAAAHATPRPAAQLAALQRFLETGQLRWNDSADIEALARELVRDQPEALADRLLQPGDAGDAMRRRWQAQFGDTHWPELAGAWMQLEQALCGDAESSAHTQAWQVLLIRVPARLRGLMKHLGRNAGVRRRIVERFTTAMRGELLALLAGSRHAALQAVIAQALQRRPDGEAPLWRSVLAHCCLEEAAGVPTCADLLASINERPAQRTSPQLPAIDAMEPHRTHPLAALAGSGQADAEAAWDALARDDPAGLREPLQRRDELVDATPGRWPEPFSDEHPPELVRTAKRRRQSVRGEGHVHPNPHASRALLTQGPKLRALMKRLGRGVPVRRVKRFIAAMPGEQSAMQASADAVLAVAWPPALAPRTGAPGVLESGQPVAWRGAEVQARGLSRAAPAMRELAARLAPPLHVLQTGRLRWSVSADGASLVHAVARGHPEVLADGLLQPRHVDDATRHQWPPLPGDGDHAARAAARRGDTDTHRLEQARQAPQLAALQRFLKTGRLHWNDSTDIDAVARAVLRTQPEALADELLQPGELGEAMRRRWREQFADEQWAELAGAWVQLEQALCGQTDAPPSPQAWQVLLAGDPARLRGLIKHLGRSARVRQRIAERFTAAMRGELLGLLAGSWHAALQAVIAQAMQRRPQGEARLWHGLLAQLCLDEGAGLPTLADLLAWIDEPSEAVNGSGAPGQAVQGVPIEAQSTATARVLRRMSGREGFVHGFSAPRSRTKPLEATALPPHRVRLLAALARSGHADFQAAWHALGHNDPDWLAEQLRRWGRSPGLHRIPESLGMRLLSVLPLAEAALLFAFLGARMIRGHESVSARRLPDGKAVARASAGVHRVAQDAAAQTREGLPALAGDSAETDASVHEAVPGPAGSSADQVLQPHEVAVALQRREAGTFSDGRWPERASARLNLEQALCGETDWQTSSQAWQALLTHDRAWLRGLMLRLGCSARVRRRITEQFTVEMRGELLALLAGSQHAALQALIMLALEQRPDGEAALWSGLLAQLCFEEDAGSLALADLLAWIDEPSAPRSHAEPREADVLQPHRVRLLAALASSGHAGFQAAWDARGHEAPAWLPEQLQRWGRSPDLQRIPASLGVLLQSLLAPAEAALLVVLLRGRQSPGDQAGHETVLSPIEAPTDQAPLPGEVAGWVDDRGPERASARVDIEQASCGETESQPGPQAWQTLLAHDPAWLRTLMKRLGRSARMRRRIAERSTPEMRSEWLALLAGSQHGELQSVITQALQRGPDGEAMFWSSLPAQLGLVDAEAADSFTLTDLPAGIDEPAGQPRGSRLPAPDPLEPHRTRLLAAWAGGGHADFEAAFDVLERRDPAWLREQLQRWGRSPQLRRRMARRWPASLRMRLLAVLAPAEAAVLATLLGAGGAVDPAESPATSRRMAQALWTLCFAYVAGGGAGQGSRACADALLNGLSQAPLAGDAAATERMRLRLRMLGATEDPRQGRVQSLDAQAAVGSRDDGDLALWRTRVELALASGEVDGMAAEWRLLLRHDREGLRAVLRRQGRQMGLPQRMAQRMAPAMRLEALGLLAASENEGEVIAEFIALVAAWHGGPRGVGRVDFACWLLEQALAPMLSASGAGPRAADSIAALLRQIGPAVALPAPALLQQLKRQVLRAQPGNASLPAVQRILASQQAETAARAQAAMPASSGQRPTGIEARITALCARLQRQAPLSADEAVPWQAEAHLLLAQHHEALRPALRAALEAPGAGLRLAGLLPSALLADVLRLLRPGDDEAARRCVQFVAQACAALQTPPPADRLERLGWQFMLRELVEEGRRFVTTAFLARLLNDLARQLRWSSGWRAAMHSAITRVASTAPALAREVVMGLESSVRAVPEPLVDDGEPIYVKDAGLVLVAPYLLRMFDRVGLLQGQAFIDELAEDRALHLLHFMVTGAGQPAEPFLVLPRLLCGVQMARPVPRQLALTAQEHEAAEGLLGAMIQNWKILGRTSVTGLRQTFLQRQGRLVRERDAMQLQVAAGPFDMLLDQLPWGYATVKLPWMPEVLHVQWR